MTVKPIVPRELANRDIDDAIAYYLSESTEQAVFDFIDARSKLIRALVASQLQGRHAMLTN